jgi:hypothetical protein
MTAIDIMAHKLDQELQERGVLLVSRADCVEIIRSVIDHASQIADGTTPCSLNGGNRSTEDQGHERV